MVRIVLRLLALPSLKRRLTWGPAPVLFHRTMKVEPATTGTSPRGAMNALSARAATRVMAKEATEASFILEKNDFKVL
jgi:hypothetical protein